ncbi:MAG: phosphate-starvation-inducible PsiE family protein [Pseudomonadota bacterium]
MNLYERFEQVVAMILSFVISVVVVIAMFELVAKVWNMLLNGMLDPLDHQVFQAVFGAIMTLLIAMEFKHSIMRVVARRESIIQVKTVVFIAILALARKFIILDTAQTDAPTIAALALTIFALAGVYWLIRDSDSRHASSSGPHQT